MKPPSRLGKMNASGELSGQTLFQSLKSEARAGGRWIALRLFCVLQLLDEGKVRSSTICLNN
jgi:hypothetical protein